MIDASFLWTEPHSRRLKVKLTIQKEVGGGTLLQQTIVVEFIVSNLQCDDCKRTWTPHLWQAQVQVRQKVDHKRTFLFLEQMILKHNAQEKCIGIQSVEGGHGLNFQFRHRSHAVRLVDFIHDTVLCREKHSKQLVSHDEQSGEYHFKYTYNVELAPVCRDDLVILPPPLSRHLGGVGPMVLVYKISKFINIIDIRTMQTFEIDKMNYWKDSFKAVLGRDRLSEFIVLNIENVDNDNNKSRAVVRNKFRQVQVEIARVEDFGVNDRTFIVNTHLGDTLKFNDTVLAYDLTENNLQDIEDFQQKNIYSQDIIIVKKTFPKFRHNQKKRLWKLKHLQEKEVQKDEEMADDEEIDEENKEYMANKKKSKGQKKKQKKVERKEKTNDKDYQLFLQDIEEDEEFRAGMNLYKDQDVIAELESQINKLSISDKPSELKQGMEGGKMNVEGEDREVKTAKRRTQTGKDQALISEKDRKKNEAL
mmetsp:Transcript_37578/g.57568  ORF Transcript_37578/g.57568 Transcript_37578/m.57568 type:complete len:476 (-) Transcript_37578:174-1601(-)